MRSALRVLPRGRIRPGSQFRRNRPGHRGTRAQGGLPVRPRIRRGVRGLRIRSASGEPLRTDAPRADGEVLGGLHQRPHSELPQVADRPDRQLRQGMLGSDRRQRKVGREGPARGSGADPTGCRVHRQRGSVPRHKAVRQAMGANHLVLGERDRGRRDSSAPVRLRRERPGLPPGVPRALQRGHQAHPRRLQPLPDPVRGGAVPARAVLRGIAPSEPAAVSEAGEVRPRDAARPTPISVPGGVRTQGGALRGAPVCRERRLSPAVRLVREPGRGRHRAPEADQPPWTSRGSGHS